MKVFSTHHRCWRRLRRLFKRTTIHFSFIVDVRWLDRDNLFDDWDVARGVPGLTLQLDGRIVRVKGQSEDLGDSCMYDVVGETGSRWCPAPPFGRTEDRLFSCLTDLQHGFHSQNICLLK